MEGANRPSTSLDLVQERSQQSSSQCCVGFKRLDNQWRLLPGSFFAVVVHRYIQVETHRHRARVTVTNECERGVPTVHRLRTLKTPSKRNATTCYIVVREICSLYRQESGMEDTESGVVSRNVQQYQENIIYTEGVEHLHPHKSTNI